MSYLLQKNQKPYRLKERSVLHTSNTFYKYYKCKNSCLRKIVNMLLVNQILSEKLLKQSWTVWNTITSSSSSWGVRNLRKYTFSAVSEELHRPAVPDNSPNQKHFDCGSSMLVCPKCNNQNFFIRNSNTKAGPAIKCTNSSCRHCIACKSFFSFGNHLLGAARAIKDSNAPTVPRPAVSIPSS